jgi:hypothetical protein
VDEQRLEDGYYAAAHVPRRATKRALRDAEQRRGRHYIRWPVRCRLRLWLLLLLVAVAVVSLVLTHECIVCRVVTGLLPYSATDAWDKRTNLSILERYFCEEVMTDAYRFSDSGLYFAPPGNH